MATAKKTKNISAGVGGQKTKKAPMVDPNGAWTKVQERTLPKAKTGGCLSCGGKMKKKK